MPIGTTNTALIFNIKKPPLTRSTKSENTNFWLEIFEFLAVQAIDIALAPFTAGVSELIGASIGLSDLAIAILSTSVEVGSSVAIWEIYDAAKKQITFSNTLLNFLPILGSASKVTRGYRTTKALKLAQETKVLQKLGVISAKNIEEILKSVANKKIITPGKYLFDYTKINPNRETLLQNLGMIARNEFRYNYRSESVDELEKLLQLQKIIQKISPTLVPKLKILKATKANLFLQQFNTDIDRVLAMSNGEFNNLLIKAQKTNRGSSLIWTLNQLREQKSDNAALEWLSAKQQNLSKFAKKLNPNYYIKKEIKLLLKPSKHEFSGKWKTYEKLNPNYYLKKLSQKTIEPVTEEIERLKNIVKTKLEYYIDTGKKFFSNTEKKMLEHAQLVPLKKPFLGVRTRVLTPTTATGAIYYRDARYKPIIITESEIYKFELLITAPSSFGYYMYESGWSIGWGMHRNSEIEFINFAPPAVQSFIKDSYKVYRDLLKIYRGSVKLYTIYQDPYKNINAYYHHWKNNILTFSFGTIIGVSLVNKTKKLVVKKGKNKVLNLVEHTFEHKTKHRTKNYKKSYWKEW